MFFTGLAFIFIPSVSPTPEGALTAGEQSAAGAWAYVGLFSIVGFCSSYALGLGNVPWVVQSELFYRHELRAVGSGLATGEFTFAAPFRSTKLTFLYQRPTGSQI